MASDSEACCESDPNFAVICGFLEKFGVTCGLANIDFLDLQDMLENSQEVPQELVDLHVKLLRKARKSVSSERWERALIKLCHGFCIQDAWEIERFGYKKARLSSKLRILKELLEMQFDYNAKFKNEINKLSAEELRTQPLGRDRVGHVYWFQSDNSCQIRIYKEDPDEETWSLVAKDREGLVNLITQLNDGQITLLNEDSSSLESEKPVVDTGQTDSNSNSDSSKQDQASTDTNAEENEAEVSKKEENDNEKTLLDEEDITQNNIEVVKIKKMKLKNNKVPIDTDSGNAGESHGNGNGESIPEQESKNETNSEKEDKDKSSTVTPPKTGISIRIKPMSELISSSGVDVNKKPEITGVKEKYIRSDCSSSSSVYHRKAVDSAGFDVHTNYLKRPIEEEEDVQEPSYIKRPRLDRPTLLGNKKKKPYSDEEEEEEEEVSDEVEEPLMLVTGEGFGQDNEGGNSKITDTGSPVPEDDSPIVGEEVEESVVYFYGEGNGHECETGNETNRDKQDVASQQQNAPQNTTSNVDSASNPNLEHTSHESNKADTVDSIKDSEPSSNNDETDCSVKTPTKSEIKLGTIIDIRTNKSVSPARDPAKKSRWDMGKPQAFGNESQTSTEGTSKDLDLQYNSNSSNTKLELEKQIYDEQKIEDVATSGKVQELVNQWEKFSTPLHETGDKNEQGDDEISDTMSAAPKKTMFFFGPGCLQVKPTISPIKSDIVSESVETDIEQEQISTSNVEDNGKAQKVPNLNSENQEEANLSILPNLELKSGSYEVTVKTKTLLAGNDDAQSTKKECEELKNSEVTFKKPQVQKPLFRNVSQSKQVAHKSDVLESLRDRSEETLKNTEKRLASLKVLEKDVVRGSESKVASMKKYENILDNNLSSVKGNSKIVEQESIKSGTSKISAQSKVAETSVSAKEIPISTIIKADKITKNNDEVIKGDSKKCDNLKLSFEEKSPIKQPETSTSTISNLEKIKEEDKICNLPNNIVTGNDHVPKNSVSEKELEKIDSSNSSISDDQKDNKVSDVPVSEESHISNIGSEKIVMLSPKVAGLPVAEEQVENLNTSVLDNKPKSKLEDVQEDIKKVNIQKTDSIDLSIKSKDSGKLESNISTSEQPCSIEMQMAMIMGENLSDLPEEPLINATPPIATGKSSTTPSEKSTTSSDVKVILENPPVTKEIPCVKPPSEIKAATTSSPQKLIDESTKPQIANKNLETVSSTVKKIVLKRSIDETVSSINIPSSSVTASTLISKPPTVHSKEETSSSLKKESHTSVPSIKSSIEKKGPLVAEPSKEKIVTEVASTNPIEVKSAPISIGKSSGDIILPVKKSSKPEDTPAAMPVKKLDEKEPLHDSKDISSVSKVKLPEVEVTKKNPESVVTVAKKLDNIKPPDTIPAISKPIIAANVTSNASDDTSAVVQEVNAIKETLPTVKKSPEKQPPDKLEAKSSVSANKTENPNVAIISSTKAKATEAHSVKNSVDVNQDVKAKTSDKVDSKSEPAAIPSKPSTDNFRIPGEYPPKKPSVTVSPLTETSVLNISDVIVHATSGIPSNVNKTRVISLTEILSTSEKVPLSATKGGINKPSTHKQPVIKEPPDGNKPSLGKSKGSIDIVVNKLSTDVKAPSVDKGNIIKVNKASSKDVEDKIVTNKKGVKAEVSSDSTLKRSVVEKPAAESKSTDSVVNKPSVDTKTSISKNKPLVVEPKQPVKAVPSKNDKPTVQAESTVIKNKPLGEAKAAVDLSLKDKPLVEAKITNLKGKSSGETTNIIDLSLKDKPSAEVKGPVDLNLKDKPKVESPKGESSLDGKSVVEEPNLKDKSSIEVKTTVDPNIKVEAKTNLGPRLKDKQAVEAKTTLGTSLQDKPSEVTKSAVNLSSKNKAAVEAKGTVDLSLKSKAAVESKTTIDPSLKDKPLEGAKTTVDLSLKGKAVEAKSTLDSSLKEKPPEKSKSTVDLSLKGKAAVEGKTTFDQSLEDKPSEKAKSTVDLSLKGKATIVEAKTTLDSSLKDKPSEKAKSTVDLSLKGKATVEAKTTPDPGLKHKPLEKDKSTVDLSLKGKATTVEAKTTPDPGLKDTPLEKAKSTVDLSPKGKATVEAKTTLDLSLKDKTEKPKSTVDLSPKGKATVEAKTTLDPSLKDKPLEKAKSTVDLSPKGKATVEAKTTLDLSLKDKTSEKPKSTVDLSPKGKATVEAKTTLDLSLKDKTSEKPKSTVDLSPKGKATVQAKTTLDPSLKDKPSVEAKATVDPNLKDKPSAEAKSTIDPKLKDKPSVEAKSTVDPNLKDKPAVKAKSVVDSTLKIKSSKEMEPMPSKSTKLPVEIKESTPPELPVDLAKKSDSSKDKSSVDTKVSIKPNLPKQKPVVETLRAVITKDKPLVEAKKSVEPIPSKTASSGSVATVAEDKMNKKSDTSLDKPLLEIKSSQESSVCKNKLMVELTDIKSLDHIKDKNSVESSASKKKSSVDAKDLPETDVSKSKEKEEQVKLIPEDKPPVKTKRSVAEPPIENKESVTPADDSTANRRSTRRTRSSANEKPESKIDDKNKKPVNNKITNTTKKAELLAKKAKKTNEKIVDETEIAKVVEPEVKPQPPVEVDVDTVKGKGKQKKKITKEIDNSEKSVENKKQNEPPPITGDTNRELRQRKVTEPNKPKPSSVNDNEEKKPKGKGKTKPKASTVNTPKDEDKTVSSFTRSQALSVKDKAGISKENETASDLIDIEEQIVKTEIRPSKKLRLTDSSVEVTVVDKSKKTVTTISNEKGKESDNKTETPRPRRSLRSNQITNADTAEKIIKDQPKVASEPKQTDTEKKENAELKPVEEPLCVQKKVPLLTCIDINKLKAQPESTTEEEATAKPNITETVDSSASDDSCGAFDGGDVGIDADSDSSDDAVIIIPENDPLACSDNEAPESSGPPPMTLSTFKLDMDDTSPTIPATRVTRKRAAQQSIDALRETRIQGKKTPLEKKEEVDSKRPKLKKRSVDRNLRRSIEEQKLKVVSSSEEEEEADKDGKVKNETSKQESGKKSKGIAKRRISTRSTRATESPAASSDAPSEASRTDASNTPPVIKEKKPRKQKKTLLGLDISEVTESIMKGDTPATVRQSRRIAQIKIKEEAERRKLEEVTLQELKDEQCKRKSKKSEDKDYKIEKRKRNKNIPTEDETTCDAESDEKKKRKRKRKHWDPTKKFDLFKAWKSSSGSSSSEIEDEEEEIEEDEDHHVVVKSDHEFSPESDLEEGAEVQPLKRARTARKEKMCNIYGQQLSTCNDVIKMLGPPAQENESDAEEEVDDCACQKCGQKDHPEWILLCDSCDCGWHCSCLRPALLVIPEGDWFCPPCQHVTLVKNLEERLHEYDRKINKKEMETRRKERLAYVGISLDNVLPSKETDEHRQKQRQQHDKESGREEHHDSGDSGSDESDSDSESGSSSDSDSDEPVYQLRERRQAHSYRFNDYDALINSAIQDELEAVKGAGNQGRGKDIATIVNAEKEEAEAQRLQNEAVVEAGVEEAAPTEAVVTTDLPGPAETAEAAIAPETTAEEPLPPVVPPNYDAKTADDSDEEIIRPVKRIIGKKKHRKLNSLDVSSGDDAESDEDFKGSSSSESEEDFDEDEYSGSDSSDANTRRGKRRKDFGPVRRSTRARISRYDRDFVNDSDSEEEEAPRRKKTRSIWDESESEESDRSWGRKKRKAASRSTRRKSTGKVKKSKKKKKKRRTGDDSDPEVFRKKPNIKFGGLNDDEEIGRRTRGKKINYLEALGTDSEEEIRRKPPRIEESEEEYNLHEDEDFQHQLLENDKDSDESGVDTVLQDIAKNTQPRPKARGRGKSGLKIPRKPKDAPPPEFPPLMQDLPRPSMEPPSMLDPTGLQPLQSLQSLQPLQSLMAQPPMMPPSMVQDPDLQDPEDEPNPIEQINKNVEEMNEQEMEKMMEEEDYANKQLQLVALQIEKEKKRKEREAKRLEKLVEKEQKIPKKRGRKPKNQMLNPTSDLVPSYNESTSMMMNSVMANNAELSEPPGISLPMFSEIAPVLNVDGSPKKRRGRGKGKKTLAAEAAAIAAANKDSSELDMGLESHASSGSNTVSPAPDSPMHGTKLGIAAPPQPFAQSQPTPSVITRMLQSQPGQGSFPGGAAKYFGGLSADPQLGPPPGSYHPGASGPRGPMPGPYQQPPPGMPHYPVVRSGPAPPHRLHSPGPPGLPPMYHTHRSMDPSPSGGGPINVSTTNRDRHSPAIVPPSSSSPLSKGDPTPPPPPYSRPQVGHFPPGVVGSATAGSRHVSMVPPHLQQHRGSNMSPYHPGVPPNYHYGSYPPPPPLNADEGQSPPVYPSPAYSEPYPGEGGAPVQPTEGSSNKAFDDDTGGEFVGLVSYFSSQREDDLDT